MKYSVLIITLILSMFTTSCAFNPPVQEMSDARQAIRSAQQAGADKYSPEKLGKAVKLLEQAQHWLNNKAYGNARQFALDARDEAIVAREVALSKSL